MTTNSDVVKEFKRVFKVRYNRDVDIELTDNNKPNVSEVKITYKGDVYFLTEYRKDGMTEFVHLKHNDQTRKYRSYLEAEVTMVDHIGEKEHGESR